MPTIRWIIILFLALFPPIFSYGTSFPSSTSGLIANPEVSAHPIINSTAKIFLDDSNLKECADIPGQVFQKTVFPYYPGTYNGTIWIDIEIEKSDEFNKQPFTLFIDADFIDFQETYICSEGSWNLISSETYLSAITSNPLIPIIRDFYGKDNIIHIRVKMRSCRGDPISVKIYPNNELFKTTTISLSWFYLSGGIGACIFFFLLIVGILLKDPAYILLALSSLFYILRAMQVRDVIPIILSNHTLNLSNSAKLEYLMDCLGILSISFCAHFFSFIDRIKGSVSKLLIAIIELGLIKLLLLVTIDSNLILFISSIIISILQNGLIIYTLIKNIINNNAKNKIIFLCWESFFTISTILRIVLLARNFAFLPLPDFIEPNDMISSAIGFFLLYIPPLYTIGRRFNIRYQYVQTEYQNLEIKFLNRTKLEKLTDSVSTPIANLASSVLNSACILSKLNFSAVNAAYIELIKRESSKINDLLVAVRILEGTEEPRKTPILLLNFFNSCMMTIRRVASEKNCNASLTTAIANDTIISADPRILQLLFIITPTSIISLSKPNTKVSIYIEEDDDNLFIMTVANHFASEELDSPQSIAKALNENSYFDFLNELSKIYRGTMEIHPLKESCRMKFKFHFDKIEDTSDIKVVTDKTTFEISDNSQRLFKDMEKQRDIDKPAEEPDIQTEQIKEATSHTLQSIEEEKAQPAVKDIFDRFDFSTREKEIATLIIEGKSDKEIAFQLSISPQTVATHNKKIFKKTGVHSRVELINKVR
ncbi:MAG: LuxR C-terminal-related transcriptional regulator [Spirochaetales bacterium]|nr:LuxR C-terminal-related transcriptional regulator [Spirochaetales bacterium]